jgi:hypothetical protein
MFILSFSHPMIFTPYDFEAINQLEDRDKERKKKKRRREKGEVRKRESEIQTSLYGVVN